MTHRRRSNEIDARALKLHFSTDVKQALRDLEAAVHFSEHFSGDMKPILHDWAAGKPQTVHNVLIVLPLIAEATFAHVRATGDERAAEAWGELCSQMNENGFALTGTPTLGRH